MSGAKAIPVNIVACTRRFVVLSQADLGRPVLVAKIFRFSRPPNHLYHSRHSTPQEGRIMIVTDVGAGCGGRGSVLRATGSQGGFLGTCERSTARGREMLLRTAKSCGPDAPTLASSFAEVKSARPGLDKTISADDGGKRARSPGRARRKPLKPLRAGMPGDSGVPVASTPVLSTLHRGLRVQRAPGIPHALQGGERFLHNSGASRREIVKSRLRICGMVGDTNALVMPGLDPGIHPSSQKAFVRRWITGSSPVMTIMMGATTQSSNDGIKTGALSLPHSQLSYLAESKQRHPPELLVKDRCAGDRRLGALARRSFFGSPPLVHSARLLPKLQQNKIVLGGQSSCTRGVSYSAPWTRSCSDGRPRTQSSSRWTGCAPTARF